MIQPNERGRLGQQLVSALASTEGVRLGESTVISRRVHVVAVDKPEEVRIVGADAGRVFYGRGVDGTVYHIDVFHQVGCVDHRAVARVITDVMRTEMPDVAAAFLDRMDIQTATGGGRLTGSLTFGRKESLRRAHANHVHIASELESDRLPLLVPVVAAVEAEIIRQGLEIRKVERVILDLRGHKGSELDMSAYMSESDSFLREEKLSSDITRKTTDSTIEETHCLVTETLPPAELLQLLRSFPFRPNDEHRQRWGDLDHTLETLRSKGHIARKRGVWTLTVKGQTLLDAVNLYLPELESRLRRFLRRLPARKSCLRSAVITKPGVGRQRLREKSEVTLNNQGGQLNLAATATQAACRWISGQSQPGCIHHETWRYSRLERHQTVNIILLVDSSASMAGDRLRAARLLAQHLVLSTRDRVAVIAFQGESVLVPTNFSSSLVKIQAQLLALKAVGLTPLAHALQETILFVRQHRVYRPLVVLITDGIPTVALAGGDPSADALTLATHFRSLPLEFACIGLNPNQSFLEKLSQRSGGQLYVVEELDTSVLAQLVHKELQRRRAH